MEKNTGKEKCFLTLIQSNTQRDDVKTNKWINEIKVPNTLFSFFILYSREEKIRLAKYMLIKLSILTLNYY